MVVASDYCPISLALFLSFESIYFLNSSKFISLVSKLILVRISRIIFTASNSFAFFILVLMCQIYELFCDGVFSFIIGYNSKLSATTSAKKASNASRTTSVSSG
jgi:hypothetical protein